MLLADPMPPASSSPSPSLDTLKVSDSPSSKARSGRRSSRRSATARGFGDLSENFEYHAAKNEQGLNERDAILRERCVRNAVVVEAAAR